MPWQCASCFGPELKMYFYNLISRVNLKYLNIMMVRNICNLIITVWRIHAGTFC